MITPVLQIENLTVAYRRGGEWLEAVRGVSFHVHAGETFGVVGESGSGKTTLALAAMRYLGENGAVKAGRITLAGRDLLALSPVEMEPVWGKQIALVPQNPQSSLNPSMLIGEQLAEVLRHQFAMDAVEANRQALDWFERVHMPDPDRVANSYPHQVSAGMQQRVLIATALCTEPQLLILDEPTSNLDVTTQAVILDLVRELIRGRQTAVLYVTHNLGVVAQVCDRVGVLYAGEFVEQASTRELFSQPLHPYTQGLLASVPLLGETKEKIHLWAIPGQIPPLGKLPGGCVFRPRCGLAVQICETQPPLYVSGLKRVSRCHRWEEIQKGEVGDWRVPTVSKVSAPGEDERRRLVLNLDALHVDYPQRPSLKEMLRHRPARKVSAVRGVSLAIPQGRTVGLVGESGSGKTSLARAIMGLTISSAGSMELLEIPLPASLSQRDLATLRHLQMMFQNPEEALNPFLTVGETLRRPLIILLGKSRAEADREVADLLQAVRLPASYAARLPGQLSGGELQRIAIARAFASNPALLICDEPVSALDVSVQAAILNLLLELQAESGSSLLLISHDLAAVGYLADEIAVIYLGSLMEVAQATDLFQTPYHPYTEALLSAIPLIDPTAEQRPIRLAGDIPSPTETPTGCPFHTRCPRFLGEICQKETPPWREVKATSKRYYCHIPEDDLRAVQERLPVFGQPLTG